jgi:hypothetical protein
MAPVAVDSLSLWARRGRWPRPRRPNNSRDCEFELPDTRVPVESAGVSVVFAHGPEGHTVGRIDGGIAIIAPASVGAGLAASAGKHCSFPLAKVTWRVTDEASGITNAREHAGAGRCIANGRVAALIDGYAGHPAKQTVTAIGELLLLHRSRRENAASNIELIPANCSRPDTQCAG